MVAMDLQSIEDQVDDLMSRAGDSIDGEEEVQTEDRDQHQRRADCLPEKERWKDLCIFGYSNPGSGLTSVRLFSGTSFAR